MNILIPHKWLLEQLNTKADAATIQQIVSLSGPSVERIEHIEGDSVYDIEVTTNRVDCMSIRGMAREMAVIMDENGIPAKLNPLTVNKPNLGELSEQLPLPKVTDAGNNCRRIMYAILNNVKHTPTPPEMATRLRQIGQREHDSVIDITNYVTHEYGHPIHAFDYDKIMNLGGVITIVEAKPGQSFTTLDGQQYSTKGGEIVFVNDAGTIIDLPAIMGTQNSVVDSSTKRVLLWIESLDAKKVREASMRHSIRTVAAQLNEKNVDPELAETTFLRALELYHTLSSAELASELIDIYPGKTQKKTVFTDFKSIEAYLGISLAPERIASIMKNLGCTTELTTDGIIVTPPSFRSDIAIPADVIEEVARIYGYHNLPSTIMPGIPPTTLPENTNFSVESRVKRILAALGAQEVYTYSMVSAQLAAEDGFPLADHLLLSNPLSDDRVILRRSLIPSLEELILANADAGKLTLFELANCYHPIQGTALPLEELHLTLLTSGNYRYARALIERMLREFFIECTIMQSEDSLHYRINCKSAKGGIADIGSVSMLANGHIAFDIIWARLLSLAESHPVYQPLPKAAPVIEDLTFELPKSALVGQVLTSISKVSELISSVHLVGQYVQRFTFRITYQHQTKTLSSDAVAPVRKQIVDTVENGYSGSLVGNLQS